MKSLHASLKLQFFLFPSNAKWIILLESLIIELYLDIKIYLDYFPGRLTYAKLENQRVLNFEFQYQKMLRLYHNLLRHNVLTSPVISKYVRKNLY